MKLQPIAAAFSLAFNLSISKRVEEAGKTVHKEIAKHQVPCPSLADFGIEAEQSKDKDGKPELNADNLPVYAGEAEDWLFTAIIERVKSAARAKVDSEGKLLDGKSFASTFEELTAESVRGTQALADFRDAAKSFAAFLEVVVKSAPGRKQLLSLFAEPKAIATAETKFREALGKRMAEWFATLAEADQTRFSRKVAKVAESIAAASETVDAGDL